MHSIETRTQFLKLRVQGYSFNRIAKELGVSKPTLIAWSRKRCKEIQAQKSDQAVSRDQALKLAYENELQNLNYKVRVIRQELNSRKLQAISTEQLQSILSELEANIQSLETVKNCTLAISLNSTQSKRIQPNRA